MKNSFKKYNSAFTLVELLVVIAFIGIMTSVALVSFQSSKDKKIVETEARKVAATIREAQNYALTGKGISVSCGTINFCYNNSAQYSINGGREAASCTVEYYKLGNGANFTNTACFTFSAPWGNVSASANIGVKRGSYCSTITVTSSGNVTEGSAVGC
ncbi:MAG: type II secretion system protein [Parcubacteria group bacterium]|jgi:prepilin-type N-terminal cleavage/methylation domain-containing protein